MPNYNETILVRVRTISFSDHAKLEYNEVVGIKAYANVTSIYNVYRDKKSAVSLLRALYATFEQ